MTRRSLVSTPVLPSLISNTKIKLFFVPMNTFSDLSVSSKCPAFGGDCLLDGMMGLQQPFAGAFEPAA
jgi:hypothetical protein